MKRIISFIILAVMMLCTFAVALPTMAAVPDGIAINNEADFASMSAGGKYYLAKDIKISASYPNAFMGTFDGNGHKIIIAEGANVSPFKKIEGATFKNLTVEGVINVTSKTSYGGIAVEGYGDFENVTTKVGISAMVENSFNSVGASQGCFIGNATGECSFVNCTNESSVTVITQTKGTDYAGFGGFIGLASTGGDGISFVNCENNASVTSHESSICVGGFIGISNNTDIIFSSCNNNAFVIGTSEKEGHNGSGGFIGTMMGGSLTVQNCHNIGDVQNNGPTGHTGGLVGRLSGVLKVDVDGFKNMRAIYNTSNFWEGVGGLIGIMSDVSKASTGTYTFKNCMNCGWVRGSMAGGIVGLEQSAHGIDIKFERCLNTAQITTLGDAYSGGILGRSNGELRGLTFSQCLNVGEVTANTSDSWGVGGICGNIGEDGHTYNFSPTFENCINVGTINCKSSSNAVSAAGILSRNNYTTTIIKNCINLGTLTHVSYPSNIVPITAKCGSVAYNVSGCSYLSGMGNPVFGETAKSVTEIRTDVAGALTVGLKAESEYYNYRNSDADINSVGEGVDRILSATTVADIKQGSLAIYDHVTSLVLISDKKAELLDTLGEPISNSDKKYTSSSYDEYFMAYGIIKLAINSANDAQAISVINVPKLKSEAEAKLVLVNNGDVSDEVIAKKAELLELLGEKIYNDNGDYTLDSYEAYSDAYLSIKSIIENAKDMSVLEVIDVEVLKDAAEAKLVKDKSSDESDVIIESEETKIETEIYTETSTTSEVGCGKCSSSAALSAFALASVIGAAFVMKKKD